MLDMNKAVLIIDTPACCGECFALDDRYDYPICIVTQEKKRMDKCPLVPIIEEELE